MIKVGVTGSIGSGKTMVCRIFETLNILVFHADDESKKILFTNQEVIEKLRVLFGEAVFSSGNPDRKKIASIVFSDSEKLRQLNSILHPATFATFSHWCSENENAPYVLMEAALIYETGAEKFLNKVIVVTAPEKIRISRTMQRDQVTEKDVKARMKNQLAQQVTLKKADFTIANDGEQMLITQVVAIHERLLRLSSLENG